MDIQQVAALVLALCSVAISEDTFTAAVYDHPFISGLAPDRAQALKILSKNLYIYVKQTGIAKAKGADLIVFPEYGLTGSITSLNPRQRSSVYPYMEKVPEPDTPDACMPCQACNYATGSETTNYLACLARDTSMYITANLVEKVDCTLTDDCPHNDGLRLYNTNIIISPLGCILAKYHKFHLFGDELELFDHPDKLQNVYVDTPLGRLGTLICFDLVFEQPGLDLVHKYNVDTILFPAYWTMLKSSSRLYQNIAQYSSGWARRMGVNFLAANIRNKNISYGSAISNPNGLADVYFEPDNPNGKLLISKLSKKVFKNPMPTGNIQTASFYKQMQDDVVGDLGYHVKKLEGLRGTVEVCYNELCCKVEYDREIASDLIVLAAYSNFQGERKGMKPRFEVCLLQTCKNSTFPSCFDYPIKYGSTVLNSAVLSGHFASSYAVPFVMASNYQMTGFEWGFKYDGSYNEIAINGMEHSFLSAAITTFYKDK